MYRPVTASHELAWCRLAAKHFSLERDAVPCGEHIMARMVCILGKILTALWPPLCAGPTCRPRRRQRLCLMD